MPEQCFVDVMGHDALAPGIWPEQWLEVGGLHLGMDDHRAPSRCLSPFELLLDKVPPGARVLDVGLDLARDAVRRKGSAIVVEGYLDLAALGRREIRLVDQVPAAGVDEDPATLHLAERRRVDHVSVLIRQRAMEGDHITAGKKFVGREAWSSRCAFRCINRCP